MLYMLNNNFLLLIFPALKSHHCTFCLHEFATLGAFYMRGIILYLHFGILLISCNILCSEFILVVAYVRIVDQFLD
jgi:hypothetical protein